MPTYRTALCALVAGVWLTAFPARANIAIDFVTVGDPDNPKDENAGVSHSGVKLGKVLEPYRIGRTEVTNAQYAAFLNAVDPSGTNTGLNVFNPQMASDPEGGILFSASADSGQHYSAKPGFATKPVVLVSYLDAMRFCNWLHNGQPTGGGTETGAYTLNGDLTGGFQPRNPDALYFLPSESQWYKAAFYDPTRTSQASPPYNTARGNGPYWLFATRSDYRPTASLPTAAANCANWNNRGQPSPLLGLSEVGSYPGSASYYGTLDQDGNAFEMTEAIVTVTGPQQRVIRGDYWGSDFGLFLESEHSSLVGGTTELPNVGFRVAATPAPPEIVTPGPIPLVTVGNPENPPDNAISQTGETLGAVSAIYRIGRTEVTNAQYITFLNAVQPTGSNALQLYNSSMTNDADGGILFDPQAADGQHYSAKPTFADKPVVFVNCLDAMRFCNWHHNSRPPGGGTETGAYTLNGDLSSGLHLPTATALYRLPTESEWYKAAFYDPTRPASSSSPYYDSQRGNGPYWWYPTRSDIQPAASAPGPTPNTANWFNAAPGLSIVGNYTQSPSHYGTYDQAGNVWEWTGAIAGTERIIRGDYYYSDGTRLRATESSRLNPLAELPSVGFRVVSPTPPPTTQSSGGSRVQIVTIGDSITQGNGARKSYRYPLWVKLIDLGGNFDLVGSLNYNDGSTPDFPVHPRTGQIFDRDHEGHALLRSDEIRAGLAAAPGGDWMASYQPDVALIHVGTADCLQLPSFDVNEPVKYLQGTTAPPFAGIIDLLRARNPKVVIFLAKIIPIGGISADKNARVLQLNAEIPTIAAAKNTPESPIYVVDQYTGFDATPGADTEDGVHPSAAGEEKIAERWFEALQILWASITPALDENGQLTGTFRRVKTRTVLNYEAQISSDFSTWRTGPSEILEQSVTDIPGTTLELVTLRDLNAAAGSRRFFRLLLRYGP